MSAPPDDLVRRTRLLYDRFARRDIPGVLGMLGPDVEWSEPENPYNPAGGARHGHAGFLEWARVGNAAEEVLSIRPQELLVGDDCVAVVGDTTCRVRATGRTYSTAFVHLLRFRDGMVVSFREFFDTFAAAEAFRTDPRGPSAPPVTPTA